MNNGLSSFKYALFQSVQRRLMRAHLTRVSSPSASPSLNPMKISYKKWSAKKRPAKQWMAGTLSVASLVSSGLVSSWLLKAHPVQAQAQLANQVDSQQVDPQAQLEGLADEEGLIYIAQGMDGLPTLPSPNVPVPEGSTAPATPPAIAPPTEPNAPTSRPESQLEPGNFFEPTIRPANESQIPEVLSTPGTQTTPASLSESFNGYHLGPGDSIFVSVQRYPDLSLQATLDLQGNVDCPLKVLFR
jgi:hypothetical protein